MPNKCPVCGKRFKYIISVQNHLRNSRICSSQVQTEVLTEILNKTKDDSTSKLSSVNVADFCEVDIKMEDTDENNHEVQEEIVPHLH